MASAMLAVMLALFAASVPIAIAIGLAAVVGMEGFTSFPLLVTAQQLYVALDRFPLAAIPFFILAGNLMEAGGISARLVDFAKSLVGGLRGGLAITCILTCMIFAAISGSSVATTFAIGAILIPAMVRHGYPVGFAAALQATAAELGVIVPPSIPMILFGVATQSSIPELFVAGFLPGLLIAGALILYVRWWCGRTGAGRADGDGRLPVAVAARKAAWALTMPAIILGGIYGGVTTPTEASVIAVLYALVVGVWVHRAMGWREVRRAFEKSVVSSAVIMVIIAMAGLFSYLLNRQGVPDAIGAWLVATFDSAWAYLLAVNLFLFVVGMFVETSASIIVLAPILTPAAQQLGVDPVHFGMIMVVNLALGMITPPFGVNLFAACQVAGIGIERVVRHLVPFVAVVFGCLLLVTYLPWLSLALRDLLYR